MATKRRQRGSIRRRVNKAGVTSWQVRVSLPPHPLTGERQTRTESFLDYDSAEMARTKWLAEIDEGLTAKESALTVEALCRRWLDEEAPSRVRPSTLANYRITVNTHIIPNLGSKRAAKLAPSDVAAFRAALLRQTGVRSTQLALQRLKQILAWAVAVELLRRNVAAGVRLPVVTTAERQPLDADETQRFLTHALADYYWPLWHVLLATGLRRGEALGLCWRDLDAEKRTLTVRQAVVATGVSIQEPKSAAARRTIDLDARTVLYLNEHRERQRQTRETASVWVDHGLIFCTRYGQVINPRNVLRNFGVICEAAGIDGRTIHDLRHTHATHLLLANVPVGVVSRRLGHSKTSITLDIYGHLLPGYQGLALGAIEQALYGETRALVDTPVDTDPEADAELLPETAKGAS